MCREAVGNEASKQSGATHNNNITNNGDSNRYLFSFYCGQAGVHATPSQILSRIILTTTL